jgi:hypothetical protein
VKRAGIVSALAAGVLVVALSLFGCSTTLEPREDLRPVELDPFVYDDLAAVLATHVDEEGRVDYATLAADGVGLDRFYARLAATSPVSHPWLFGTEEDQLAYWINAYNAVVMALVKAYYPITSVRDVRRPWIYFFLPKTSGFFYFQKVVLGGEKYRLYTLEREMILKQFSEPRLHFALNCASGGCPRLPREPFLPKTLDEQLDREARIFFSEERNLRIDHETETVYLTELLEWYAADFTGWMEANAPDSPATVRAYAARYADEETAAELRGRAAAYAVEFVPYDWALNDGSAAAGD